MSKIVMRKALTLSSDNSLIFKAVGIICLFIAIFAFTLPSDGQNISSIPAEQKTKDTVYLKPSIRLVRGESSRNGNAHASIGNITINLNTEPKMQNPDSVQDHMEMMPKQDEQNAGYRGLDMVFMAMLVGIVLYLFGLFHGMSIARKNKQ